MSEGPSSRVRAITIQQPWAWAICELEKRLENRLWKPSHEELAPGIDWLAIHAGKSYDTQGALTLRTELDVCVPSKGALVATLGCVVAVARYLGTVERGTRRAQVDRWFIGPHALELGELLKLPHPVACRGALGVWDLPAEVLAAVREGARAARRARGDGSRSGVRPVPQPASSYCASVTTRGGATR